MSSAAGIEENQNIKKRVPMKPASAIFAFIKP